MEVPSMGIFRAATPAYAHCDLYCGVYDPAQAKIEALSCLKTINKYHDSTDEHFKARAIIIKEQRAEEVKHHLMVLWADFFTADHRKEYPELDDLVWEGIHGAGEVKKSLDAAVAEKLLETIDKIGEIFWKTEKAKGMGVYPPA
jgi:nickel superoxide dismutase